MLRLIQDISIRGVHCRLKSLAHAPTAVIHALTADAGAADQARAICAGLEDDWELAARRGLDDPRPRSAANRLLALAAGVLRHEPPTASAAALVEGFTERWTARGLSPADDPMS